MVSLQEPNRTSKGLGDSGQLLMHRKKQRELQQLRTSGQKKVLSLVINHPRVVKLHSTQMSSLQAQTSCTTWAKLCSCTSSSECTTTVGGRISRSSSPMQVCQERENTRFWTSLGLSEHNLDTMLTPRIAFTVLMQIWLCWAWAHTNLTSTFLGKQ